MIFSGVKMTKQERNELIYLHRTKYYRSLTQLAITFDLTPSTVCQILKRMGVKTTKKCPSCTFNQRLCLKHKKG